jgi:hypothetical protein
MQHHHRWQATQMDSLSIAPRRCGFVGGIEADTNKLYKIINAEVQVRLDGLSETNFFTFIPVATHNHFATDIA